MSFLELLFLFLGFKALDIALKGLWGLLNFGADRWLRKDGWDEEEEFTPMRDYIPVWRLFRGVKDLKSDKIRRTRI